MATIRGYSVANTQGGGTDSGVYSKTEGRQMAYDSVDISGLKEGRHPTLKLGKRTAKDHDATGCTLTTAGTGNVDAADTAVVATTTTLTGTGAGLIVKFTATNAGALPSGAAAITPVTGEGGEEYAADDTVSVDGWSGSVLTLAVA